MLLYVLLFSIIAIAVFTWSLHYLGYSKRSELDDKEEAVKLFLASYDLGEHQKLNINDYCFCNKNHTALFQFNNHSGIGVLNSHGSHWHSYMVDADNFKAASYESKKIKIKLNDYANPARQFLFDNDELADRWYQTFNRIGRPA